MMKFIRLKLGVVLTLVFIAVASIAPVAWAIDPLLETAKESGVIGERADGYLGFVRADTASNDLKRRVAEVNAKRREVYTRKSQQTGESLSVIAALTAERQIARVPGGEYYMNKDGVWTKK
ncbi:MAG: hypothetical protein CME88_11425 [Hirschia sp.]|nr:hypothetical protein [Hirschia sp.]MBB37324.1 hypothetical protein [Hirschia sp.]MBF18980.1 hypothetical protein [Hirschia sp.]|tara:strand:- start:22 stop:384 length:363 start_codon:yes stop_codon:yes gene_type:complete